MFSSAKVHRLLGSLLVAATAARAAVTTTVSDWTGLGSNPNWTTASNWALDTAPANDGTADIRFGGSAQTAVYLNANQHVKGLTFDFSGALGFAGYTLSAGTGAGLTVGANGITVISGPLATTSNVVGGTTSRPLWTVYSDPSVGITLGADQTWSVAAGSALAVGGVVSGAGKLALTGGGMVSLEANNTHSGGTALQAAQVWVGTNSALGTGTVTVEGNSSLLALGSNRTLANAFELTAASILNVIGDGGFVKFTGPITLSGNTTLSHRGDNLFLDGNISGPGALTLTGVSRSPTIASGVNTYTGGTAVHTGGLIFRHATSLPSAGSLSSQSLGYVGIAFNTGTQSAFISKFDRAITFGTIGFDTDAAMTTPLTYAEAIDLTGFNGTARLGTSTRATISGAITPAMSGYRFGGGGGTLTIESRLTGLNGVVVDSDARTPLTLKVVNPTPALPWNDYVGPTSATNSAILFGPGALSPGAVAGSFFLESGGYIGSADASAIAFIPNFAPTILTGVIGFDSVDLNAPRTVSGIDLRALTALGSSVALGTATAAIISGGISLPFAQTDYHFTGYKGGWLTVNSSLSGAGNVHIGDSFGLYPVFDGTDRLRMSTVFLNGSNSHTGGVKLHSGRLVVGNAAALGTGPVTIRRAVDADMLPRLETSLTTSPTFSNPFLVENSFDIGGVNALTLSGNISSGTSGAGRLSKHGNFNLTLSGNNTAFTGGFFVGGGTLTFVGADAVGAGANTLDFGVGAAIASFLPNTGGPSAPIIAGLHSQSLTSVVDIPNRVTLTIDQAFNTNYAGKIQGAGAVVKSHVGALRLDSASTFTGGTTINGGTLVLGTTNALGTGSVLVNGLDARLAIESGATLANSLTFGANGGELAGNGIVGTAVTFTANSGVSPGPGVGQLTFNNGLTWNSGAFYDVDLQDGPSGSGVRADSIHVNGILAFNATLAAPFQLHLTSLTGSGAMGNLSNFVATNAYTWQIVTTTGGITNFNPAAVLINIAGISNHLGIGSFYLATSGTNLTLNFTPIPEPSTWVLMLTGLSAVLVNAVRRRRR